ncbi:MAG: FliA/WhiG family RNA polymerase sigma factor [Candidatus Omnitrophica bacterium]|nr:FliA/WhiG family RNA polymerase sigma factor [Candidatus Omnitrophota bacterium]
MQKQETPIAREKILEYLPLIKKVVSRIFPSIPSQLVDFEDLVGYGIVGLIEAMNTYDSKKGVKLSTYAFYRIRGAILDALRSFDWIPRQMRKKFHIISQGLNELTALLGREPTSEEVAAHVKMDPQEVDSLLMDISQSEVLSLEDQLHNYLKQKTDNFLNMNEFEFEDLKKAMSQAIDELPERERLVLVLYYYEELNLKEIGKVLEISESRISQILKKATVHLREKLDFIEKEL